MSKAGSIARKSVRKKTNQGNSHLSKWRGSRKNKKPRGQGSKYN